MENASKALIIAGAILLSILIISLGIMIFNQASGVVDNNAMSEVEATQFNQRFMGYTGTNIRGAQVNSLINAIVQNNVSNSEDDSRQIKVTVSATKWQGGSNKTDAAITSASAAGRAQTGRTYDVDYDTDSKTGFINKITIKDSGSGSGE